MSILKILKALHSNQDSSFFLVCMEQTF